MLRTLIAIILLIPSLTWGEAPSSRLLGAVIDAYPSPSPDGALVVFQSNRSGRRQIWRMNADGSDLVQLTDFSAADGAETPVWSPDGSRIAFAGYTAEGKVDVFVMAPDGSDLRQLTDSPGYDGHQHWSADGERIFFNSDRTSPDPEADWSDRWHEIFSMRADGSDVRQHTHCRKVCTYGSVSPDGERILYRQTLAEPGLDWALATNPRNSEVFVANLDGSAEVNLSRHPAFDGWPAWSPDGAWIVFASNRSGPALAGQLWLVRPDGSELHQLTSGPWSHAQPAWMPDSSGLLAYRFQETSSSELGSIAAVDLARP